MPEATAEIGPKTIGPAGNIRESELIACVPRLRAYAIALTKSRDSADDLLQETVLRALTAAHQFQAGTSLRAWMFTILRNTHFNEMHKNRMRARSNDGATGYEASVRPGQEASLEFSDFRRAFWQLGNEQREALILVGANGMSHEDAAKLCDCAPGTVKSRVSRARRRLLQILETGSLVSRRRDTPASARCYGDPLGMGRI
jgi:RNA polymerase sigma-70 factor (ECF subfamily)